jgi:trimeric autotransporter adhesin
MKTNTLSLIISLLISFALLPNAQAVSPPPDGGYPGGNTAEGQAALFSLTTGGYNTAIGFFSLRSNTKGSFNTAVGAGALLSNMGDPSSEEGIDNTATGAGALLSNTTGGSNTANGAFALFNNTTGVANTAGGAQALQHDTSGAHNTATGAFALFQNTIGGGNTANGITALQENTTGNSNTADGDSALFSNTTGGCNTANGDTALFSNTTGNNNTANGVSALFLNATGSNNIALGAYAAFNLTTGDYNIDIGNAGVAGEGNTIRIGDDNHQGATYIAGVYGVAVSGLAVVMDSSDHLGTQASSRRFKKEIKPMDKASEVILALKPVTFRYKNEIDPAGTAQFGLVAEDVEKANPDLVVRDKDGKPYSVRYDQVNAMLLNEFLKEHRKVESLEKAMTEQQKENAAMRAMLKEQAAQIQKVSAQVEVNKAAPQTVLNNQ